MKSRKKHKKQKPWAFTMIDDDPVRKARREALRREMDKKMDNALKEAEWLY